ncbi:unnamed protein product [Arabidopsis arenosa]|uniref:DUF1985 domain-containing protein n=1 Tax=Arabidopsis arenosa TaxID=38785 RepID=A0A8S2AT60_ARAAE|nr:unnamed protein product [Arabidopsis arenosa]
MILFREGSEPNGVRVQSYSELGYIDEIANSLDTEDMKILKKSQFGKVFDLPEGGAYSGKLIHFLLTRQLVVSKRNEILFSFGGSPIRFSISEFERLTCLNCSKPPAVKERKSKRKLMPGKYWYKLFDRGDVSVEWVVGQLKKHLVEDQDMRLRYAVLALIDGVLCPTSSRTKISLVHAEMSENLDNFLNHPWGTTSFLLTLKSIRAKGAVKLMRKSATVQGDSEMEDIDSEIERLWSLNLDIVWKVDKKSLSNVPSILSGDVNGDPFVSGWLEDEADPGVDHLLQLVREHQQFDASLFLGRLVPDSLPDDRNDNSDICSTQDTVADETLDPPNGLDRVLKALADSEARMTKLFTEALRGVGNSNVQILRDVDGNGEQSTKDGVSGEETIDGSVEKAKKNGGNYQQGVSSSADIGATRSLSGGENASGLLESVLGNILTELNDAPSLPAMATWQCAVGRKKRKRGKTTIVASGADGSVSEDLGVHGPGVRHQAEDVSQQDPDEPPAPAKNVVPETVLHSPDALEQDHTHLPSLVVPDFDVAAAAAINVVSNSDLRSTDGSEVNTLHSEKIIGDKEVNAALAACIQEDLGDESMPPQNEARCVISKGLLPEENLLNPVEPSPDTSVPPTATTNEQLMEVPSKANSPNPLQTSELPSDTVIAPCTSSRTVTFGHNVGRVDKIRHITSLAREINFGTNRTLSSTELRDIVDLKSIVPQLVMDIFINSIRIDWQAKTSILMHQDVAFIDSTFVYELFKHYPKFSKTIDKGMYEFDHDLLECTPTGFERVYIPFLWVMAAHLVEAHAAGGIEACKRVKLVDVFTAAKKYMIAAYELANGTV